MAIYNIGERVDITATVSIYNSIYFFTTDAVSAVNAIKHAEKDFPGAVWELETIYK